MISGVSAQKKIGKKSVNNDAPETTCMPTPGPPRECARTLYVPCKDGKWYGARTAFVAVSKLGRRGGGMWAMMAFVAVRKLGY
jgi:hypothetical protein